MSLPINFSDGTKVWFLYSPQSSAFSWHVSKDEALDQMRRTDELYSFVVSQFSPEKP